MRKLIEIPDNLIRDLKHLAIDNDMSLKAYIEYILFTHASDKHKKHKNEKATNHITP